MQLGPKLDVTSLVARDKQMTKELEISFSAKLKNVHLEFVLSRLRIETFLLSVRKQNVMQYLLPIDLAHEQQ